MKQNLVSQINMIENKRFNSPRDKEKLQDFQGQLSFLDNNERLIRREFSEKVDHKH